IVSIIASGQGVIAGFRSRAGATDPTAAAPGPIRGDFGRDWGAKVQKNLVHGSDSTESADPEIGIWYPAWGHGICCANSEEALRLAMGRPFGRDRPESLRTTVIGPNRSSQRRVPLRPDWRRTTRTGRRCRRR